METTLEDFRKVAALAHIHLPENYATIEVLDKPHKAPNSLLKNKMAIYIFEWEDEDIYLKVGKVGSKSNARYTSQHYNAKSSYSNLSKSILSHQEEMGMMGLTEENIGNWIKKNTTRTNILIDEKYGTCILSLLEAFLHCRLNPKFEGRQ